MTGVQTCALPIFDKDITLNDEFFVRGGKKDTFTVRPERNSYVFSAIDKTPEISYYMVSYDVKAPVAESSIVGYIEVYKDNILIDTVNVVAAESVEKASFGDYLKQNAERWAL